MSDPWLAISWGAVAALGLYGLNCYVLAWRFLRVRRRDAERVEATRAAHHLPRHRWPRVTVQLPVYDERLVVDRLVEAACALRYPRDRLEVQVLDDSTDDTTGRVARLVRRFAAEGVDIVHLHRTDRAGFKAGALAAGLERARGEWIAVFDADFVPGPDFLERTVPFLADARTGVVQCRWEHLDRELNVLTRLQALAIDGHFGVEQVARCRSGWFLNFNGTAGVWRRRAIEDAGGWTGDTLTEDLDLSYRAQLAGWRIDYLFDTGVPAELPVSLAAFKSQQRRWAKGSIQTARKLLGSVLRAELPVAVKVQAALHLTHYLVHPLMLVVAVVSLPVHLTGPTAARGAGAALAALLFVGTCGPTALYVTSQRALGRPWRTLAALPALMLVGTGIALSNTRAVLEALAGRASPFVRTPKDRAVGRARARTGAYRPPTDGLWPAEAFLALWTAVAAGLHLRSGLVALSPFLWLYALGFGAVALGSWREARGARRAARDTTPPDARRHRSGFAHDPRPRGTSWSPGRPGAPS